MDEDVGMQRAVLVGLETDGDVDFEYGMEELKGFPLDTCGSVRRRSDFAGRGLL